MENVRNQALDGAMAGLLALGCGMDIGIPSWALKEAVTRRSFPLKPRDVLGLSKAYRENSIVGEYLNKKGYEFSWGTLAEDAQWIDDDDDGTWVGTFEIFPKRLLMEFPQKGIVEDLLMWMYQNHPLRHEDFDVEESSGSWFVLSFSAFGTEKIGELRCWLAGIFVPKILPDLIAEAMKIVTAEKMAAIARSADGSFEEALREKGRFQLCGDPADLCFNTLGSPLP